MAEQQTPSIVPTGDRTTKEIYTDGICQVHLINGSIKMDLLTISPTGESKAEAYVNSRLVMSLNQFLSSLDVMNKMADKLVETGYIKKG